MHPCTPCLPGRAWLGGRPHGSHDVVFARNYSGPAAVDSDTAVHACVPGHAQSGVPGTWVLHSLRVLDALSPLVTLRPRFSQHLTRSGSQAGGARTGRGV